MEEIVYVYHLGIPGIYLIFCEVNCKYYIGSACDLYTRTNDHKRHLIKNKHINRKLQEEWNKFGKEAFKFYVLNFCQRKDLEESEQFYFDLFLPYKNEFGYNTISKAYRKKLFEIRIKEKFTTRKKYTKKNKKQDNKDAVINLSVSEAVKESWKNLEIRAKRIEGLNNHRKDDKRLKENLDPITLENKKKVLSQKGTEYFSDPVHRQQMSELKKEQYENNPELRQKISETTKEAMAKPEVKENLSKAMKKFNQENPERVLEIQEARNKTYSTEKYRAKSSERSKELWATEEHRNKMCTERKERFSKQENKDKMKSISNDMWNDPVKYQETLKKRSNITDAQFKQLEELHKLGYTYRQIANVLGISRNTVARICRGDSKLYQLC